MVDRRNRVGLGKWWLCCLALAVTVVVASCATVPMAPVERDMEAKKFVAPADKARIYLYRNETYGAAVLMTVALDGKLMGQTVGKTYFMWDVDPGEHTVSSHTENVANIVLQTEAGKNYFVWQEVKMGMWQARSRLQQMDQDSGCKAVLECSMAQSAK